MVLPLSFNAQDFFTFTPEMLAFDPEGYSLKHYRDFFSNSDWQNALRNSVQIAPMATLLSVGFGTLAAIGLSQPHVPFRRAIMAILISPMIVPLIISAAGMYFFYSRIGLQGTYLGVVLAHAALGIPFVIITVTATLVGFDNSLTRAAANMGASPVRTFFKVQMPLILPGVISGGLFASITSFDEVVVVLFVGSAGQKTLPWQMFTGLREHDQPDDPGRRHNPRRPLHCASGNAGTAAPPVRAPARHVAGVTFPDRSRLRLRTRRARDWVTLKQNRRGGPLKEGIRLFCLRGSQTGARHGINRWRLRFSER